MRAVGLLVALILALAVAACGGDDGGEVVEGTGYEVTVPDGWDEQTDVGERLGIEGFRPDLMVFGEREDGFTANVNILHGTDSALPLDAQVRRERELLERGGALNEDVELEGVRKLTPVERITLAGTPARAYEFELEQSGRTVAVRQVIVKHDEAMYVITLTAVPDRFDTEVGALESILESWEWR